MMWTTPLNVPAPEAFTTAGNRIDPIALEPPEMAEDPMDLDSTTPSTARTGKNSPTQPFPPASGAPTPAPAPAEVEVEPYAYGK
jgi:hypothetical protein